MPQVVGGDVGRGVSRKNGSRYSVGLSCRGGFLDRAMTSPAPGVSAAITPSGPVHLRPQHNACTSSGVSRAAHGHPAPSG